MIVGIGTDIVEVARIEDLRRQNGERLARRILTESEFEVYTQTAQPGAWLAKRFAAKEATAKALGTGIAHGVSWRHIEVLNDPDGAPCLTLKEAALTRARALQAVRWHVSLSDERACALAFVILES
jgi:holo-[acyl-carrier protein] synthase